VIETGTNNAIFRMVSKTEAKSFKSYHSRQLLLVLQSAIVVPFNL
jgi:hypothetical protein